MGDATEMTVENFAEFLRQRDSNLPENGKAPIRTVRVRNGKVDKVTIRVYNTETVRRREKGRLATEPDV